MAAVAAVHRRLHDGRGTDRVEARADGGTEPSPISTRFSPAPDAILTVDAALTIKSFNRAAEVVFSWPAAEIIRQPLALLIPASDG